MAPMVDVVLVILVFFMATVVFVGPEWFLAAGLPRTDGGDAPPADAFALPEPALAVRVRVVDGAPVVFGLGGDPIPLADLESTAARRLSAADPAALIVRLSGGDGATWQHVVAVQDVLSRLGVRRIGLEAAMP
ncbi:MAG: biopolymer transporter ExbD [Planctomycetota bacterium]